MSTAQNWTVQPFKPRHDTWPYKPSDFKRLDESDDAKFYSQPRNYVYHIDEHAVESLKRYYATVLPDEGSLLDLCSSWTCLYPETFEIAAVDPGAKMKVIGVGMSKEELETNRTLAERFVVDLNKEPDLSDRLERFEFVAATCCVSIDYLAKPREVLQGLRKVLKEGAMVHLVVSNRMFATKVVRRWLEVSEEERVGMVGDYLQFSGFEDIEIVEFKNSKGRTDPLWVVRARKV
ncbi:hypothetical protein K490DRAFT_74681 [Saccharata proteae CBS 121410]|uniref:S-adenosyl-L-methionine-dependent methyltransferase n=1 Tax=Saccharata proteae CBS 121410 TaxID=1314787 RepID=A0A9P4HV10_9PEZI|nr:hypothetical protein K490DRAFT_74681 [Saccharata proteae CBS 121410]